MSKLIQELLLELDNGPRGRIETDKINYGAARSVSYEVPREELQKRKAMISKQKEEIRKQKEKARREMEKRFAEPKQKKLTMKDYGDICGIIEDAVGRAGIDADPIDYIIPKMKKFMGDRGYGEYDYYLGEILDTAMQKVGIMGHKYKSWQDYLADMWDDYIDSTYEPPKRGSWGRQEHEDDKPQNPWR